MNSKFCTYPESLNKKPKLGILGIMQDLYDDSYPDIIERQNNFILNVVKEFDELDFGFFGPARNRQDIEKAVLNFNSDGFDGIVIVMLTYSPGLSLVSSIVNNRLPLLLANIQPESAIDKHWDMSHLTFNQGVHGAQDTANVLLKAGMRVAIISEDWKSERFRNFVIDWGYAAKTSCFLRQSRFAMMGQMPGMADILTDSSHFMFKIGSQIDQVSLGTIYALMESVKDEEIEKVIKDNVKNFEVDTKLSLKSHSYAAKLQIAIEKFLIKEKYAGFSIYFNALGCDGRFKQLHMMAASNLMAKGYGYAAEGDMCCTTLIASGHNLAGDAHFTEMYAMDFSKNSVLQSHMGEGNWKIARKDQPIRLIDRRLDIGQLENPPTILFMGTPGVATIASLCSISGKRFKLIVAKGKILDTSELPNIEMPYFHFKPDNGLRSCLDNWLKNGGTHHQCLNMGDQRRRWKMLSLILGIEYVEV
jgi:L-arabinose isomerase